MKNILVLPLLFLIQYFFAQDASVKWAALSDKGVKVQVRNYWIKVSPFVAIGEDENGKPINYDWSTYTGFQKFAGDDFVAIAFVKTAHHSYLTGTIRRKKENQIELYLAELSNAGKPIGQPKQIAKFPYLIKGKLSQADYASFYDKDIEGLFTNNDKTLLTFISPPSDFPSANDEMNVVVFDEDLNVVWNKKLEFPVKDGLIDLYDVVLTSNGTLIFNSEMYRPGKYDAKKESQYISKLWICKSGNLVEAPITVGANAYPADNMITEIDSNHVMVAGFYTNELKPSVRAQSTAKGTFVLTIDLTTGKTTASHFDPFNKELAELLEKTIRFSNGQLTPSHNMEVIALEKSNTGEVLFITGCGGETSTSIYQGSHFYFTIAPDLKTTWETTVASSMRSSGASSGAHIINRGDKLTVLYNEDQPKYAFKVSTIDFKGKEISTETLPLERGLEFSPNKSYWLSTNKVAVAGYTNAENSGGKRLVYGIVTVK